MTTLRQEFLALLAAQGEHGIRLDKMPPRFLNTNLLTVCDAERVIEFLQRKHEYNGDNLRLVNGWDIRHFTGRHLKPISAFIGEILAKPDEIAEHVRLTEQGHLEAARLAIEQPEAEPAKPNATTSGNDRVNAILAAVTDDITPKILKIAGDTTLSSDAKLRLIARLDSRFKRGKTSGELGTLIGVTSAAIRDTDWWKVDRKKETCE